MKSELPHLTMALLSGDRVSDFAGDRYQDIGARLLYGYVRYGHGDPYAPDGMGLGEDVNAEECQNIALSLSLDGCDIRDLP